MRVIASFAALLVAGLIVAAPAMAGGGFCPPGLAKKAVPCVPPGQAKKGGHGYDRHDDDRSAYRGGDYRDGFRDGYRAGNRDDHPVRIVRIGEPLPGDIRYVIIRDPGRYGLPRLPDDRMYLRVGNNNKVLEVLTASLLVVRAVDAFADAVN